MNFLAKIKAFVGIEDAESVNVTTGAAEELQVSSLVALATLATGKDAEQVFPALFLQEVAELTRELPSDVSPENSVDAVENLIFKEVTSVPEVSVPAQVEGQTVDQAQSIAESVELHSSSNVQAPNDMPFIIDLTGEPDDSREGDVSPPEESSESGMLGSPTITEEGSTLVTCSSDKSIHIDEKIDIETSIIDTSNEVTPLPKKLTIRDIELMRRVGGGTFGDVFLSKLKSTGGFIATKVIKKRSGNSPADPKDTFSKTIVGDTLGEQSHFVCESAMDECFAFRRAAGIKGVTELLASFHDSTNFYFVMHYYAGGDLQTLMTKRKRFCVADALIYLGQILNAVEHLHKRGIIHRDIKPGNIFIDSDGTLKLGDLGLARLFDKGACEFEKQVIPHLAKGGDPEELEMTGTGCGTRVYMSPEQYEGKMYSYPVDVFAVGVTMFRMLVGRSPWSHGDYKDKTLPWIIAREEAKIDDSERTAYGLNKVVEDFLQQALMKDPRARASATDLKRHPLFEGFDWEALSHGTMRAPWIPGLPRIHGSSASQDGKESVKGRPLGPLEDFIPFFAFVSPQLAHAPTSFDDVLVPTCQQPSLDLCDDGLSILTGYPSSSSSLESSAPSGSVAVEAKVDIPDDICEPSLPFAPITPVRAPPTRKRPARKPVPKLPEDLNSPSRDPHQDPQTPPRKTNALDNPQPLVITPSTAPERSSILLVDGICFELVAPPPRPRCTLPTASCPEDVTPTREVAESRTDRIDLNVLVREEDTPGEGSAPWALRLRPLSPGRGSSSNVHGPTHDDQDHDPSHSVNLDAGHQSIDIDFDDLVREDAGSFDNSAPWALPRAVSPSLHAQDVLDTMNLGDLVREEFGSFDNSAPWAFRRSQLAATSASLSAHDADAPHDNVNLVDLVREDVGSFDDSAPWALPQSRRCLPRHESAVEVPGSISDFNVLVREDSVDGSAPWVPNMHVSGHSRSSSSDLHTGSSVFTGNREEVHKDTVMDLREDSLGDSAPWIPCLSESLRVSSSS